MCHCIFGETMISYHNAIKMVFDYCVEHDAVDCISDYIWLIVQSKRCSTIAWNMVLLIVRPIQNDDGLHIQFIRFAILLNL
jgi:hypothetical protein